jgi:Domain of unknown function (DUF6249)
VNVPESIIALGICIILPVSALITAYMFRYLASKERLYAIEKGVNIPFEIVDPRERAARARRWGIILLALGIGMAVAFAIVAAVEGDRDALNGSALGVVPALIGAGLLIDFRMRTKELDAAEAKTHGEQVLR